MVRKCFQGKIDFVNMNTQIGAKLSIIIYDYILPALKWYK